MPLRALLATAAVTGALLIAGGAATRRIAWADVAPVQAYLAKAGLSGETFDAYIARTAEENRRRVREGDLDHLIFFLLQSTRISRSAAIEPALSAREFADSLPAGARAKWLRTGEAEAAEIPAAVTRRIGALLEAIERPGEDARLLYFRALAGSAFPAPATRAAALRREYVRVMRFVYEKEFETRRAGNDPAATVAELYRQRGLSTDTAIEAGFIVHLGLGVVKGLQPERRIRRVLIVGPGLDLAPRTALDESVPPQSYQPWAVIDALLALGLSSPGDLHVVAADINPRVVAHLRGAAARRVTLDVRTDLAADGKVAFSEDFRAYFGSFGAALSKGNASGGLGPGRLRKRLTVSQEVAAALHAEALDLVTERLDDAPFDLIVATNILPYFDDRQLALAVANIAAMLAPGGTFLHNEPRPLLGAVGEAAGLPFQHSRHAVIATVAGAKAPLGDSVFLHRKQ